MIRWLVIGWFLLMAVSVTCMAGEAAMGTISGLIEDPDGEPFKDAEILVLEDSLYARLCWKIEAKAASDAQGKYSASVRAGKYVVIVRDPAKELIGEVRTGVEVKAGQDATVRVGMVIPVNMNGTCQMDDRPVEHVVVWALYGGWPLVDPTLGDTQTDQEGNFLLHVRATNVSVKFTYPVDATKGSVAAPVIAQGSYRTIPGLQLVVNANVDSTQLAELCVKGLDGGKRTKETRFALADSSGVALIKPAAASLNGRQSTLDGQWDTLIWQALVPGKYTLHALNTTAGDVHQPCVLNPGKNELTLEPPK